MLKITTTGSLPRVDVIDITDEMANASKIMLDSVRRNFIEGGRPERWEALKSGGPSFLFQGGALLQSLTPDSGSNWAEVFTNTLPYAAIHQFGGVINHPGRGKTPVPYTINMPQREYLMFQQEDIDSISTMLKDHLINFYNAKGEQIG